MNKLEKQKLDEIAKHLYAINLYLREEYISNKKIPSNEELDNVSDHLATCLRNIRNLL